MKDIKKIEMFIMKNIINIEIKLFTEESRKGETVKLHDFIAFFLDEDFKIEDEKDYKIVTDCGGDKGLNGYFEIVILR